MTVYLHRMSGAGAAGDLWVSTLHSSGAASLSAVHAAWSTFVTAIHTNALKNLWPPAQAITSLSTVSLDPVTGKQTAQTASAVSLSGTGAGACLSPRDCILLSKRTALPTKAGRGRMYLPPPDSGHMTTTGLLAAADATTIANAIGNALTTFKATSQPVIYHAASKTVENITYIGVSNVLATQTRRTNRVFNSYATKTI